MQAFKPQTPSPSGRGTRLRRIRRQLASRRHRSSLCLTIRLILKDTIPIFIHLHMASCHLVMRDSLPRMGRRTGLVSRLRWFRTTPLLHQVTFRTILRALSRRLRTGPRCQPSILQRHRETPLSLQKPILHLQLARRGLGLARMAKQSRRRPKWLRLPRKAPPLAERREGVTRSLSLEQAVLSSLTTDNWLAHPGCTPTTLVRQSHRSRVLSSCHCSMHVYSSNPLYTFSPCLLIAHFKLILFDLLRYSEFQILRLLFKHQLGPMEVDW
jgi:hypothetical protein